MNRLVPANEAENEEGNNQEILGVPRLVSPGGSNLKSLTPHCSKFCCVRTQDRYGVVRRNVDERVGRDVREPGVGGLHEILCRGRTRRT